MAKPEFKLPKDIRIGDKIAMDDGSFKIASSEAYQMGGPERVAVDLEDALMVLDPEVAIKVVN